jgi:hypothetical protein
VDEKEKVLSGRKGKGEKTEIVTEASKRRYSASLTMGKGESCR